VPASDAHALASLPPTAVMFAALLGYNPIQMLLGSALTKLPASHAAYLTGHSFFPSLISGPFQAGLDIAFDFAIVACLVAAVASLLRGKRYIHELDSETPGYVTSGEATADVESAADVVAEAELASAAAVAEVTAPRRFAIAQEIEESPERMSASSEPATRTFRER
jgi:hypothetical protein